MFSPIEYNDRGKVEHWSILPHPLYPDHVLFSKFIELLFQQSYSRNIANNMAHMNLRFNSMDYITIIKDNRALGDDSFLKIIGLNTWKTDFSLLKCTYLINKNGSHQKQYVIT